ncbi:MAG: disulfide bond formation protein B [Alphaproteobacteria bacterium]|nr:disulfide bond formation protein B [Alphaproteobacteria bacterium]
MASLPATTLPRGPFAWVAARPWRLPAVVLGVSLAMLGGAWFFEHVVGLAPCALCFEQRLPYKIAAVVALAALAVTAARRLQVVAPALAIVAAGLFAWGAAMAGYHVGIEQGWWAGTAACAGTLAVDPNASVDAVRDQLLNTPVVRCDVVPWSLAGLSLAGWNFLASLLFLGGCLGAIWRLASPSSRGAAP